MEEWRVGMHRKAHRFLEELPSTERRGIEEEIRELVEALNEGVLPYCRSTSASFGAIGRASSAYA